MNMNLNIASNPIFLDDRIQEVVNIYLQKSKGTYWDFGIEDANKVMELLPQGLKYSSINWNFFQHLFNRSKDKKTKDGTCRLISEFIKSDCYNGDFLEFVETFKSVDTLGKELYKLFSNSYLPFNLIVKKKDSSNKHYTCYMNDCSSVFLSNLLKDFIIQNNTGKRNYLFYSTFQTSLNGGTIRKINDFNAETFKQQYYFYKNCADSSNCLTLLKKFYLRLLSLHDGGNILHWKDGIDGNMLQAVSFNKNYEEGFKPIPLNSFDPVPELDKWLIMPNGAENNSTKINSFSYKPIDFSLVKDAHLKFGLKNWFWNSSVSLSARIDHANICIKFINFIIDLRDKFSIKSMTSNTDTIDTLSVEEIFSYTQYVKLNKLNQSYIGAVKGFLNYLQGNRLYNVDPSVYKYLISKNKKTTNSSKDISFEDLERIEAKFKEKAENDYLKTLYHIIFHLALANEFRISQIINLKIGCLKKGVKKDYYIKSITKVSRGKQVPVPISPYTHRYIEMAKKFTQEVRDLCHDNDIKKHIFIHNYSSYKFKVITVRTFSDYLKRICLELGIEGFTAQNLRDTYMTKAIEHAMRNNMSELEIRALTNHKKLSTTTNHYVAENIKKYLEAIHRIIIGNPVIKGKIMGETECGNEDLVNEQCGYCPYESCIKKDDGLDCLMCSGFIATIDRIPYYEEKIKSLDAEIKSANLLKEKERLTTIKRLYLAYLAKLLELKETAV